MLPALLLWGSVLALALLGPDRGQLVPALAAYSLAFLALLVLVLRHGPFLDDWRVLLGGAILLRLTLLPTLPDLSDDLFRYVWDGWLTASGVNPYLHVPADPALVAFQGSILFSEMNSPSYHSVYPPLSQIVFLFGGLAYESFGWPAAARTVKVGFTLLEIGGITFLLMALRRLGRPVGTLALYAWNPLALVAVAGSGHTEGGLLAGMGLLALGVASGGRRRAWIGLVLAGASKGIPLLLAPLLLRRHLREAAPARVFRDTLPALLLGLGLLLPFLRPGAIAAMATSAELYVRLFEFNAGPYFVLREGARLLTGEDLGRWIGPVLRGAFLASAGLLVLRWPVDPPQRWFSGAILLFGLYLFTATTVHPWYLLWGLALVPLTTLTRGAWLWASWASFLTYFTYVGIPHGPLTAFVWGGAGLLVVRELDPILRDRLLRIAGRRKAAQVAPYVGSGSLLDLGGAEGYVAERLVVPGRRCFIMDLGPWRRVPIPAVVYDGRTIPLGDRTVDSVLLSLVLHHAEDADRVIREALRVSRQQVIVTESTYRWGWERRLLECVDRFANRTRGMSGPPGAREAPIAFRTVPEWEAAFREAGARIVRSRRLNRIGHRHHLFLIEPSPSSGDTD